MTVVLDSNVLFSALISNGLCSDIFRATVKLRALASSAPLLEEFEGIIARKLTPTPHSKLFLAGLRKHTRLFDPSPLPQPVCRDPDDDVVLATALAARADIIVTGDDDLLVLEKFQGIRILSPRQFLELLAA